METAKETTQFSKKLMTKIRTRHEVFFLEADSLDYLNDVEALMLALERCNKEE